MSEEKLALVEQVKRMSAIIEAARKLKTKGEEKSDGKETTGLDKTGKS